MLTGTQSIAIHLPAVRGSADGDYQKLSASGLSTSITEPPKTLADFAPNTFQNLQSPALQHALQVQLNPVEPEDSHNLATEGDIERAAALYLIHDVSLIVQKGLLPALHIPIDEFSCIGQSTNGPRHA